MGFCCSPPVPRLFPSSSFFSSPASPRLRAQLISRDNPQLTTPFCVELFLGHIYELEPEARLFNELSKKVSHAAAPQLGATPLLTPGPRLVFVFALRSQPSFWRVLMGVSHRWHGGGGVQESDLESRVSFYLSAERHSSVP